jgi:excisionase family DNA binding protein
MDNASTTDMLTTTEAAKLMNVSKQTMRRWIKAGQVEGVRSDQKYGSTFLIARQSIIKLLEQQHEMLQKKIAAIA